MTDIRRAGSADAGLILRFIMELATYEKLLDQVEATTADIERDLFGPNPRAYCDIAEAGGEPVGFAVWYYSYSTFQGRHGIYLQDLYVTEAARGQGHGKALLKHLGAICVAERLGRLDWSVLDWNAPSIAFYEAMGAKVLHQWKQCRVEGAALTALGR
jgi:GNAT superfamily N-acetyltransferase